jgi:hypothetical protein
MGLIIPTPPLDSGEVLRWTRPAGYSLETTVVGGTLYLTSKDFMFMPNVFSGRFRTWGPQRISLKRVASIGVQERTGTPYNGGLRRRVRVELDNQEVHLFIIRHPDDVAAELRRLVGLGPSPAPSTGATGRWD